MLNTKEDFKNCLSEILMPLEKYFTDEKAGIKCGNFAAKHGEKVSMTEAFLRPLWGLAPLWSGGENIGNFKKIYIEGIKNGTNPNNPEYWGAIEDPDGGALQKAGMDQKIVEAASMGLALIIAPDAVWEPLDENSRQNLCNWLWGINKVKRIGDSNWQFFPVIVNIGLKSVGMPYDAEKVKKCINRIHDFYVGDGWYTDGIDGNTDYYIPFAIQFYSLIYAKVMETEDPKNSKIFKERALRFAKDFIYWFDDDGSSVAYGRSLTYRFAQGCFWSACVFADVKPFPMGVMKGIISRHLNWWMNKPVFDNGGVLSVGYAYPNLYMSEDYNGYGSPYWALKIFLVLALDDSHEFFKAEALPLPKLGSLKILPYANMVVQRTKENIVILNAGYKESNKWRPTHSAEKYSKFAYSTKFGFCVPRTYMRLEDAGTDSMLVFVKDGMCFVKKGFTKSKISDDAVICTQWSPMEGISVETYLIPTDKGHIRRHIVDSLFDITAYDCGFAEPIPQSKIFGSGEQIIIKEAPNTNLINPETFVNAIKYEIKKGQTTLETRIEY